MPLTKVQKAMADQRPGYRFLQRVLITASGNYTPHVDCDALDVQAVGGGAGGGATGATGVAEAAAGSGGGAGGYVRKFYDQAAKEALVFPLAVTIGAAGAGGVADVSSPVAGTNTTFAGLTANGGAAGVNMATGATNLVSNGGAGGTSTGGDLMARGGGGNYGLRIGTIAIAGSGGNSFFMGGQRGSFTSSGFAGTAGAATGAGGSGAVAGASQAKFAGGAGSAGVIIVDEYAKD